jgi:hypothetical protein
MVGEILERHRELDKAERSAGAGNEAAHDKERQKRHVERIEREIAKIEAFLKEAEPRIGSGGEEVLSNMTDNESAMMHTSKGFVQGYNAIAAADGKSQIIMSAEVYGTANEGEHLSEVLDGLEASLRDVKGEEEGLKGKIVMADGNYLSGENLKELEEREIEGLIPAGEEETKEEGDRHLQEDFVYNEESNTYTCPCGQCLRFTGEVEIKGTKYKRYELGYKVCNKCAEKEKCRGRRRDDRHGRALLISTKAEEKELIRRMRERMKDIYWKEIYGMRVQIIEPCFGDITYNKGMSRLNYRGKEKNGAQWRLYAMVHNIGKCIRPLMEREMGKTA